MERFEAVRKTYSRMFRRRPRLTCAVWGFVIFMTVGLLIRSTLLIATKVIMIAQPGETVHAVMPAIVPSVSSVRLGDQNVSPNCATRDSTHLSNGYVCSNQNINVTWDSSGGDVDVAIKNQCDKPVTVEMWWYDQNGFARLIPMMTRGLLSMAGLRTLCQEPH